jgi:hypothetical protein
MEGLSNNNKSEHKHLKKQLVETGVGPGGYPEYEMQKVEIEPADLNPEQQKELRGVLAQIAKRIDAPNKYVRSGIAAMVLTGALGSEGVNKEDSRSTAQESAQAEHGITVAQSLANLSTDEIFLERIADQIRHPEQYLGEFEKRLLAISETITDWDIEKTMEYANKPVVGEEHLSRAEYVSQAMQFEPWNEETGEGLPPELEAELRNILPGLCAQESRFNADSESYAGAKGILQIMPEIWEKYGGQPGKEKSLVAQVKVAGELLSDMYRQINHRLGDEVLAELRSHFPSEQAFQVQFMLPALLNSYNAGDGIVSSVIVRYIQDTNPEDRPSGRDLYAAVGDYGRLNDDGYLKYYKDHSHSYPYQVIALAEKINSKRG